MIWNKFEDCPEIIKEIIKKGFFKVGDSTYIIKENTYPHDERCEGTMCWCNARAKRENPEYKKKMSEVLSNGK